MSFPHDLSYVPNSTIDVLWCRVYGNFGFQRRHGRPRLLFITVVPATSGQNPATFPN
jgi:hypothetical protein